MSVDPVHELLNIIDECLTDLDYVNALYWIYGISREEAPDQVIAFDRFVHDRQKYRDAIREAKRRNQKVYLTNPEQILKAYNEARNLFRANKLLWKDGLVKVL